MYGAHITSPFRYKQTKRFRAAPIAGNSSSLPLDAGILLHGIKRIGYINEFISDSKITISSNYTFVLNHMTSPFDTRMKSHSGSAGGSKPSRSNFIQ